MARGGLDKIVGARGMEQESASLARAIHPRVEMGIGLGLGDLGVGGRGIVGGPWCSESDSIEVQSGLCS